MLTATLTVGEVLDRSRRFLEGRGVAEARLDAEVLLSHLLGCRRIDLYLDRQRPLSEEEAAGYRELVGERGRRRVPTFYLTGEREFYGLRLEVGPGVLVPRSETEILVDECVARLQGSTRSRIVDVGTGSGNIALALATRFPDAIVEGVDICSRALEVARRNARVLGLAQRVGLRCGDLLAEAGVESYDLVVSNPPYVAEGDWEDLEPEIRLHEPRHALVAGPDGLEVILRLLEQARSRLCPGGWLLLEFSSDQKKTVRCALEEHGYTDIAFRNDYNGLVRIVAARVRSR